MAKEEFFFAFNAHSRRPASLYNAQDEDNFSLFTMYKVDLLSLRCQRLRQVLTANIFFFLFGFVDNER